MSESRRNDFESGYLMAAAAFVEVLSQIPVGAWSRPGLGVWTIRDLAGHAVGSGLVSVLDVLARPAGERQLAGPEDYYALARRVDPQILEAAVAASIEGARRDGAGLGDEPVVVARELVVAVAAALDKVAGDDLVLTAAGGMRVADWLPTRTFELVVHGLDLATAAAVPANMPVELVADAAALAARIGAAVGDGITVLRALTGRTALPAGFSVV
jgi:mycothiol maleylpyruvate isomerase-like protein